MLHCRYRSALMIDLVDKVLSSANRPVGADAREKVINYVSMLQSTGKSRKDLERYARAYLKEILEPDRRYSGC